MFSKKTETEKAKKIKKIK